MNPFYAIAFLAAASLTNAASLPLASKESVGGGSSASARPSSGPRPVLSSSLAASGSLGSPLSSAGSVGVGLAAAGPAGGLGASEFFGQPSGGFGGYGLHYPGAQSGYYFGGATGPLGSVPSSFGFGSGAGSSSSAPASGSGSSNFGVGHVGAFGGFGLPHGASSGVFGPSVGFGSSGFGFGSGSGAAGSRPGASVGSSGAASQATPGFSVNFGVAPNSFLNAPQTGVYQGFPGYSFPQYFGQGYWPSQISFYGPYGGYSFPAGFGNGYGVGAAGSFGYGVGAAGSQTPLAVGVSSSLGATRPAAPRSSAVSSSPASAARS